MNISGEIQAAFRQLTAEIPPDRQDGGKDSGTQRLLLGKVLRLLDDQSALIQIGGRTMQENLKPPFVRRRITGFLMTNSRRKKRAGFMSSTNSKEARKPFRKRRVDC